ncbi:2-amino-4-hydroxy-6-hydroxymethyldihydropteridine diphosphokinase [Promicromonospora sp. NPDC050880]|uniref:2-amino-4-hydroxy-6- hydroxymethyldihydropteridine diphosphokinase n=1 Tax=Promicromonospora sp. NPDC050880 TaxID=3364406 RepID=UPI0037B84F5B
MTTAFGTGVTGPDGRSLDQVRLTGVSARGYHGVLPSERQTGQEFRADVVLYLDTRQAAAGDDLARTVSYADVARDVHDILTGEPADLVETVAERIAAAVLTRPQVEAVDVCVHKPHAPIPVPFADVEVAIRRDRAQVRPVVAAPATAGAVEPVAGVQDFQPEPAAEPTAYEPYAADPEPQDFEPLGQAAEEPEPLPQEPARTESYLPEPTEPAHRAEAFEAEPLVERVPAAALAPTQHAEVPEPLPVPELIAPEPLQVIPAGWDLQAEPAPSEQPAKEPVFQPEEQLRSESVFEPVQQYEPLQDLDQRQGLEQRPSLERRQGQDRPGGFEQPPYDQFAQPDAQREQPVQPTQPFEPFDQPAQQFEPAQQFDQAQPFDQQSQSFDQQGQPFDQQPQPFDQQGQPFDQQPQPFDQQGQPFDQQPQPFEQAGYEPPQQQPDPQQNHYDQLFDQQYDQADMERTRVAGAVPDAAVGQPEQPYGQEQQYSSGEYRAEQYQAEEYQNEPRDRFDEVPAGYVDVVIAIGANLGDPQATMRSAVAELDRMPGLQITDVSPLARTAAVGGPEDQPDYLNAVLLARTTLPARALLHACLEIENLHGRTRDERWGARTLDVDLITYGTLTDSADDIEVPHPRAHERAFVLEPWSQIAPDAVLPGLGGGPVAQLAATAPDRTGIRWLALDWLTDAAPEQAGGAAGTPDDGAQPGQDAPAAEMPPALPPSLPPSGRPQVSPGGPVVEVPGGGGHPQAYPSGPTPGPGGSVPIPPQQAAPAAPRGAAQNGMPGSAVPPPEEALVPAPSPIAPRAVRDTAHEPPEHEPLPQPAAPAKPVFAPVNPSRQSGSVFPPTGGAAPQEPAAPVFAPVGTPPNGVSGTGQEGHASNGHSNGHPAAYDSDHTVIRVPGFVGEQRSAPVDGPIDSVPSWAPVRDERGRDA